MDKILVGLGVIYGCMSESKSNLLSKRGFGSFVQLNLLLLLHLQSWCFKPGAVSSMTGVALVLRHPYNSAPSMQCNKAPVM